MTALEFATRLHANKSGKGWAARCPAHDDRNASLSITEGDGGRVLLHCHAGCAFEQITAAAGVNAKDLAPSTPSAAPGKPRIVATYDYTDPTGKLVFQVVRYSPKNFRQRRPDPDRPGEFVWNMAGVERVLYRLPEVIEAVAAGDTVFIAEGERDCDALAERGLVATCNSGGAGKWEANYTATLKGAEKVVIVADKDAPGRKHAAAIALALAGNAKAVEVVELPDWNGKPVKDPADFFEAGAGLLDFLEAIKQAAPVDAGDWIETAPPPVAPILHGLFEAGDKFEIIGGSKTRKSFFTLQAALCLGAGREFLGLRIDHPWRVLLVQMEVKPRHYHRRVYKLAAALGLTRPDLAGRLQIVNGRALKLSGAALFAYVRKLAEKHGAEIIIFDPLYKITVGDENAAADIKPTLAEFDRLAEATGAAIGYVHHDSKGDAGDRDIRDRGAGSGVLARDCDARIILTAHESEPDAFVVETVTRNFPPQDGFTIGWGETETGYCFQTMPSIPAVKRTRRSIQTGPKLSALVEQCADLIGEPMPLGDLQTKIILRTGAGRDRARDIAKTLATRPGVVRRRAKARGAQWFIGAADQMELLPGET